MKDRLWFFTGATNFGINQRNPGAPDTPEEFRWNRYNIRTNTKANWKINDKLTFQQVFYYDWWEYTPPEFPTRRRRSKRSIGTWERFATARPS